MRKITDIYEEYKIMPNLQMHQLRVAAVTKQICNSLAIEVDTPSLVAGSLLHDMGNIIKFDLLQTKKTFGFSDDEIENISNTQGEFIEKYGPDENQATLTIARELGLTENRIDLIRKVVNHAIRDNPQSFELEPCICKYADMRVGPKNVTTLKDRLEEWHNRDSRVPYEKMKRIYNNYSDIEKQIFAHSNIKPEDITDESVAEIIKELKNFEI